MPRIAAMHHAFKRIRQLCFAGGQECSNESFLMVFVEQGLSILKILEELLSGAFGPQTPKRLSLWRRCKLVSLKRRVQKCLKELDPILQSLNFQLITMMLESVTKTQKIVVAMKVDYPLWTAEMSYNLGLCLHGSPTRCAFIRRKHELQILPELLCGKIRMWREVSIHGRAGAGKSQLALKLAHRLSHKFSSIMWIDASDEQKVIKSFLGVWNLVGTLDQRGAKKTPLSKGEKVERVLAWLARKRNSNWLLVFDGYPSTQGIEQTFNLRDNLPPGRHGSILVTNKTSTSLLFGHDMGLVAPQHCGGQGKPHRTVALNHDRWEFIWGTVLLRPSANSHIEVPRR